MKVKILYLQRSRPVHLKLTNKKNSDFDNGDMIPVDDIEKSFNEENNEDQQAYSPGDFQPLEISGINLPNISFDTPAEMNTEEMYSPENFNPINMTIESIPTEVASPTTSNCSIEITSPAENPRIIHGNPKRFKPAEKEKVNTLIKKTDGFDTADTDWQYNSFLKRYEFKPGDDIYSPEIESVSTDESSSERSESEESFTSNTSNEKDLRWPNWK